MSGYLDSECNNCSRPCEPCQSCGNDQYCSYCSSCNLCTRKEIEEAREQINTDLRKKNAKTKRLSKPED